MAQSRTMSRTPVRRTADPFRVLGSKSHGVREQLPGFPQGLCPLKEGLQKPGKDFRHAVLAVSLGLGALLGCASASSIGRGSEVGDAEPEQSDESVAPEQSDEPAEEAFDGDLPFEPAAPASQGSRSRTAWSGSTVSLESWGAERGIVANVSAERCHPAELGDRPEDTLWCLRRDEIDDHRVIYYAALYRAQGGALRKLVEVAYAAAPRPLEGQGDKPAYYVRLSAITADDAQSFELREESGLECAGAQQRADETFHDDPAARKAVAPVIDRVCRAVGRYSASGRRLK